jgi:2,3-dihydroxy-2,3-dihydrophenylpropionate dehydrogenase
VEPLLAGKVALVTGAGSGIGKSVVEAFVDADAQVVAFDRNAERLAALSTRHGERVLTLQGDVRSPADNERAAALATSEFGRLDVFVGNAGVFDGNLTLAELAAEQVEQGFREVFDINVLGYLVGAKACLPALADRGASMIFTVSNAGFHAGSGGGILYAASKHAVVGVVRQLAYELAPRIRVNGVAPGGTITDLRIADSLAQADPRHFADRGAAEEAIRATNPLGVVPLPEDHALLYVLLASDHSRVVTGTVVESDGGLGVRGLARIADLRGS